MNKTLVVVLASVLCVACPGKKDPAGDGSGGNNAPSDSGPPALASCMVNADCRGGELCRDMLCRTACTSSSECAGAYGTCDTVAGYCVLCLTDAQCTSNQRCLDHACAFYCRADDACTAQQFCDFPTGTCRDRECTQNADCSGGHTCQHFQCISIEPVVCTANAVTCQGNSVATCNVDGTSLSTTACANTQTCVAEPAAHCADLVCTPNALGCQDDATATVCDSTGTQKTVIPCDAGKYCTGGVCTQQACTPSATTCTQDVLQVCNAQGSQSTNTPCSNTPACANQPHGCACSNNACVPRVCAPGVGECVGNNQVRTCQPDGLTYSVLSTCPETCAVGQCLSSTCTPGATQCAGAVLLTCNAQGNGRTQADCSASQQICDVVNGVSACVARQCVPESVACNAAGTAVARCDSVGHLTTTLCAGNQFCSGGVCQAQVCTPNARACDANGNATQCNANGSMLGVTPCQNGLVCSNGACGTAGSALRLTLTWNTDGTDLDVALRQSTAGPCSGSVCNYQNCRDVNVGMAPNWDGIPGRTAGDPVLEIDNTTGRGPEVLSIQAPVPGAYIAAVHYYSSTGANPATLATLNVQRGPTTVGSVSRTLVARPGLDPLLNDFWDGIVILVAADGTVSLSDTGSTVTTRGVACSATVDAGVLPSGDGGTAMGGDGYPCTRSEDCIPGFTCDTIFGACRETCAVLPTPDGGVVNACPPCPLTGYGCLLSIYCEPFVSAPVCN